MSARCRNTQDKPMISQMPNLKAQIKMASRAKKKLEAIVYNKPSKTQNSSKYCQDMKRWNLKVSNQSMKKNQIYVCTWLFEQGNNNHINPHRHPRTADQYQRSNKHSRRYIIRWWALGLQSINDKEKQKWV